jgi:hypothetical protein
MNPNLIAPNQPRRKQFPNVHYFNDTNREVYTPFGRGHGMLQTLFDPQSRLRCIIAALVEGDGIKRVSGDTFKTLAAFVLKKKVPWTHLGLSWHLIVLFFSIIPN